MHDDQELLALAFRMAQVSLDPATQVGAVIAYEGGLIAGGTNTFPKGIQATPERLAYREEKLRLIVHAEMNAILWAARRGVPVEGCTLYLVATDESGDVWAGPPCTRCCVEIIQAGIKEIVSPPRRATPSKWDADLDIAQKILSEAGILHREVRFGGH